MSRPDERYNRLIKVTLMMRYYACTTLLQFTMFALTTRQRVNRARAYVGCVVMCVSYADAESDDVIIVHRVVVLYVDC